MTQIDKEMETLTGGLISTPCGPMIAIVDADGSIVRLDFFEGDGAISERGALSWQGLVIRWDNRSVAHVAAQIDEYFEGKRRAFDLPLAPRGNTFLQRAWKALRQVPYGTTTSYGELAKSLDPPTSARAMGRANAVNPISVVVPCHRVIGADGSLTGYGGGLNRKEALLRLEGALPGTAQGALPLGSTPETRSAT